MFGLTLPQRRTISIETGIQNGTLAIAIAASILKNPQMSIPPAIYSLIMFFTAGILIFSVSGKKGEEAK
jgi:BASS family bile acid:Na+ symporter